MAVAAADSGREMRKPDGIGHGATRERPAAFPPIHHDDNGGRRLRISPLAKRIAEERDIDLGTLVGSGPGGRITKQDVLGLHAPSQGSRPAASASPAAPTQAAPTGNGQTEVIALTKMRAAIAKSLVASKQNIPHFYETIDVILRMLSGSGRR
jgi:pyruvate dehydrogenase E2 component (dihydrolipoamide acetyltransferase)